MILDLVLGGEKVSGEIQSVARSLAIIEDISYSKKAQHLIDVLIGFTQLNEK